MEYDDLEDDEFGEDEPEFANLEDGLANLIGKLNVRRQLISVDIQEAKKQNPINAAKLSRHYGDFQATVTYKNAILDYISTTKLLAVEELRDYLDDDIGDDQIEEMEYLEYKQKLPANVFPNSPYFITEVADDLLERTRNVLNQPQSKKFIFELQRKIEKALDLEGYETGIKEGLNWAYRSVHEKFKNLEGLTQGSLKELIKVDLYDNLYDSRDEFLEKIKEMLQEEEVAWDQLSAYVGNVTFIESFAKRYENFYKFQAFISLDELRELLPDKSDESLANMGLEDYQAALEEGFLPDFEFLYQDIMLLHGIEITDEVEHPDHCLGFFSKALDYMEEKFPEKKFGKPELNYKDFVQGLEEEKDLFWRYINQDPDENDMMNIDQNDNPNEVGNEAEESDELEEEEREYGTVNSLQEALDVMHDALGEHDEELVYQMIAVENKRDDQYLADMTELIAESQYIEELQSQIEKYKVEKTFLTLAQTQKYIPASGQAFIADQSLEYFEKNLPTGQVPDLYFLFYGVIRDLNKKTKTLLSNDEQGLDQFLRTREKFPGINKKAYDSSIEEAHDKVTDKIIPDVNYQINGALEQADEDFFNTLSLENNVLGFIEDLKDHISKTAVNVLESIAQHKGSYKKFSHVLGGLAIARYLKAFIEDYLENITFWDGEEISEDIDDILIYDLPSITITEMLDTLPKNTFPDDIEFFDPFLTTMFRRARDCFHKDRILNREFEKIVLEMPDEFQDKVNKEDFKAGSLENISYLYKNKISEEGFRELEHDLKFNGNGDLSHLIHDRADQMNDALLNIMEELGRDPDDLDTLDKEKYSRLAGTVVANSYLIKSIKDMVKLSEKPKKGLAKIYNHYRDLEAIKTEIYKMFFQVETEEFLRAARVTISRGLEKELDDVPDFDHESFKEGIKDARKSFAVSQSPEEMVWQKGLENKHFNLKNLRMD